MTNKERILNAVLPRIWQPSSTDVAQMALEITDGPYKGVVYGYTGFHAVGEAEMGLIPVRYDTHIYTAPQGFVQDESFDEFTSDVLVAWLDLVAEAERK